MPGTYGSLRIMSACLAISLMSRLWHWHSGSNHTYSLTLTVILIPNTNLITQE